MKSTAATPLSLSPSPLAPTSSSSPLSVSTAPSSAAKDLASTKHLPKMETPDSDIEILEERNRESPPPASAATTKRKSELDVPSSTDAKKPKLAPASKSKTTKTDASKDAAKSKPDAPDQLVELKNGKLVLKQKPLNWDSTSSTMRGRLAFTDFVAKLLEDDTAVLDVWPKEHWGVVARLIHESDKGIAPLLKYVKEKLVDYVQGSIAAGEDDSQDADMALGMTLSDRIPITPLKPLIEALATRTNYGLDASDLPDGALRDGMTDAPRNLQIFRWELHDPELLPAELEQKLDRRRAERVEAKSAAIDLVFALNSTDQAALFVKGPGKKGRKDSTAGPVASGSGKEVKKEVKEKVAREANPKEEKGAKPKKAKVLTPEEEAEAAEKVRIKAQKDAEKESRRIAKDKATAEKLEKKAKKDAADAEKKAKAEKEQAQIAKQSKGLMGFLLPKTSPAPTSTPLAAARAATPVASKESDFVRVFKPFHVKADVKLAPTNRFRKAKSGKVPEVQINSIDSLTTKQALADFLVGVPARRIPPYNPHPTPVLAVREAVQAINDSNLTGADPTPFYNMLNSRAKVPIKLLKFKEDVRPGYQGTWSKTSRVVGPRTPFGKDTALLRYDFDSEDEWEDDADGVEAEDVNSNGEMSADDDSDGGLSDDWLCEDDEVEFEPGHEDEDVVPMDVDGDSDCIIVESATEVARRKVLDREKKSKSAKDGAKKRKLAGPLLPLVKGPYWEQTIGETPYPGFESLRIQFLNDATFGLDPLTFVSKPFVPASAASKVVAAPKASGTNAAASTSTLVPGVTGTLGGAAKAPVKPAKPLTTHLVARFLDLAHGSKKSRQGVVDDIYEAMRDDKVTKTTLQAALKDFNVTKSKAAEGGEWVVSDELRAKFPPGAASRRGS